MTTTINEDVRNLLIHLEESGFTDGFEDSVLQRVRTVIIQHDPKLAAKFWTIVCCGQVDKLADVVFNGDQELADHYVRVRNFARDNSSFVMPEWGTKGT